MVTLSREGHGITFFLVIMGIFLYSHISLGIMEVNNTIIEGIIPQKERITFKKEMTNLGIQYFVNYLPDKSTQYGKKTYQVTPTSIWWHWDAGTTPTKEVNIVRRVYSTYTILKERTDASDPVSAHFSVGPHTILQMLPVSTTTTTQGRLTNDKDIEDVIQAPSFGGIQIETTGRDYDHNPPLSSQTTTLIELTAVLMKQYHIEFSNILGHVERAPGIGKTDPGIVYLRRTRIELLKYLIAHKEWAIIGDEMTWNFYTEIQKNGSTIKILDQSYSEIMSALTANEKMAFQNH